MSIYGAMFSGVSGLSAQSQALGMISDNISNVNTVGYKGTEARFSTLVTKSATATSYSPGGVLSRPFQGIDRQGLLQSSASTTSIAVNGNGFFVVNASANPGMGSQYMYTRAGDFVVDQNGDLRNTAGFYLQGWRLNPDGTLANNVNPNVLNGLETVNVSNFTASVKPTTTISLGANLPADATIVNPTATTSVTIGGNLQFNAAGGGSASHTVTIYDTAGNPFQVTLEYTQTAAPVGGAVTWDQVAITRIEDSNGDVVFSGNQVQTGQLAFLPDGTVDTGNTTFGSLTLPAITGSTFEPITVDVSGATSNNQTTSISASANGSPNLANSSINATHSVDIQIFDSLGVPYNLSLAFVKTGVSATTPATATWSVHLKSLTRASDGQPLPGAPTRPDDPGTWGPAIGTMTFGPDGTLVATSNQPFPSAGDKVSLSLDLSGYPLSNGAMWNTDGSALTIDLGKAKDNAGMTQWDSEYVARRSEQDGVKFGQYQGVTIGEDGIVTAVFDNGESLAIYKIPLATFPNPNGLEARSGNVFIETNRSGSYYLREAKTGGAGAVQGGALEASTVDLAAEFTNMIITQRAYSASAKIITTADEMLDELVRIKR